jgi:hypothetical protein
MTRKLSQDQVLRYSPKPISRSTVHRHYAAWRAERGIPRRCDEAGCEFNSKPLLWNGRPLKLVLDHRSGNKFDNSPPNLRYLCPNCESQLADTRGGANRGRVIEARDGMFVLGRRGRGRNIFIVPEVAHFRLVAYPPTVIVSSAKQIE